MRKREQTGGSGLWSSSRQESFVKGADILFVLMSVCLQRDNGTSLPGRGSNVSKGWEPRGNSEQDDPAGTGGERTSRALGQGRRVPAEDQADGTG